MIKEFIRGDFKYVAYCQVDSGGVYCRVAVYDVDGQDSLDGFVFFQKNYDESDVTKRIDEHYGLFLTRPVDILRLYSCPVAMLKRRERILNEFMRDESISPALSQKIFSLIFDVRLVDGELFRFAGSLSDDDVKKMKNFRYFDADVDVDSFWSEFSIYRMEEK